MVGHLLNQELHLFNFGVRLQPDCSSHPLNFTSFEVCSIPTGDCQKESLSESNIILKCAWGPNRTGNDKICKRALMPKVIWTFT